MSTFVEMYDALVDLVNNNEAFYYQDFTLDDKVYRVFNYRLASYTDFLEPHALEARGIMFEVTDDTPNATPYRLACRPMSKFFNLYENPLTMTVDLNDVVEVNVKADGSLISTFWHVGENFEHGLRLKTKGSLFSEQAVAAQKFLDQPENYKFRNELATWTANGFTVNLEWCAPDNRVVIGYLEPALTVLNIRDNQCGTYYNVWTDLDVKMFPEMTARWIQRVAVDNPVAFAEGIKDMTGVEGYVLKFKSGLWVKVKTLWYLTQHRAKDAINSDRRLFEAVLSEATDDLRSLFHDDLLVIQRIENMEKFVDHHFNHLVHTVEEFYETNKDKERKDYAILGQKELNSMQFGLAMNRYTGKNVDYKAFMMRKWKEFGVKDDPTEEG